MDLFSLSVYICMKMEKILYGSLKEVSIALVHFSKNLFLKPDTFLAKTTFSHSTLFNA